MVFLLQQFIHTNPTISNHRLSEASTLSSLCIETADSAFEDTYTEDTVMTMSCSSGESLSEFNSIDSSETVYTEQSILKLLTQITEACSKFTQIDLRTSESFWKYLLTGLDLIALLNRSELMYDGLKESFLGNLNTFLVCISSVERELSGIMIDGYCFRSEFLVKLACVVYEESSRQWRRVVSGTISQQNDETMFLLDMSELETSNNLEAASFEQVLVSCLSRLRLYLLKVIGLQDSLELLTQGTGFEIINSFRHYIFNADSNSPDTPLNPNFPSKNLIDIDQILFTPLINDSPKENPIIDSYVPLLANLTSLNYFTYDPFTEAYETAERYGTEVDTCSLGCLGLSYKTMGHFTVKSAFFENSFQFLHELKEFHDEFDRVFDDFKNHDPQEMSTYTLNESKWDHQEAKNDESYLMTDSKPASSIIDDIMSRVLNLTEFKNDIASVDSSYDFEYYSQKQENQSNETTESRVIWTVAPKIFGVKSSKIESFTPVLIEPKCWTKNGNLRPIGTKSASMASVRNNNYHTKCQISNTDEELKTTGKRQDKKETVKKNVWQHEESEANIFKGNACSGIGLYAYFNQVDNSVSLVKPQSSNYSNRPEINTRNNSQNSSSFNRKYSVAPLSITNLNINSNNNSSGGNNSSSVFFFKNSNGIQVKNNCQSYRRPNTNSFSSNGESPTASYNGNTRRKYNNSITRQYSNESGDGSCLYKSSPNNSWDQNELRNTRFSSNNSGNGYRRNNNARQGGKTVYNSDAFKEGRNSFCESFLGMTAQSVRFDRRKF